MKKLTKTEKVLLTLTGPNYNSYRCAEHGVFQIPKERADQRCAYHKACTAAVEMIEDPVEYANTH